MPPLEEIKNIEMVSQEIDNDKISENETTNEAEESKEESEPLTTEEIQKIEEIIDETIDEIQANEENIQKEIPEETIKEYEEMEQMKPQEEHQVSNNVVHKEALINRSKVLDIESCLVGFKAKENEHFIEQMKELHYIKKHMDRVAVLTMGIVFACGYIMGTQHEHLSPYIGKIWDLINVFKGSGGQ